MVTVRSAEEYRSLMDRRARALRKVAVKTASQAATKMQNLAKALAPRWTGTTIEGIKKTGPHGRGIYGVQSWVPGRFKQNLWANQTAPFRTLHFRGTGGGMARRTGVVVYGDGTHRITGVPRFFHFAMLRTRPAFGKLAVRNTRKVLSVTI